MKQCTLKSAVQLQGIGLHTGQKSTITLHPAAINHGYKFKRIDLERQPTINATVDYVTSTNRSTTLDRRGNSVTTIEHLLAALQGAGIHNALIEIDGQEVPILDGSSKAFTDAILEVGTEEQDATVDYFVLEELVSVKDEETGAEIIAIPYDGFEVSTVIDFPNTVIGEQYASLSSLADFNEQIAPARTFTFLSQLAYLAEQGLIKGGDIDNAVVVVDTMMEQSEIDALATKLGKESRIIAKEGILNTTSLRFPNEPARHKLLDIVGDLALVGVALKAKIIAKKPSHALNTALAKKLRAIYVKDKKLRGLPKYDATKTPIKTTTEIEAMLPHRHPFLLVDKIIELSDTHVVGIKNVSYGEYYFPGHFPNNPIMPGVLQIEAMAQTGGILALSTVPDPENWDTYFLKIDKTKFKQKVVPGDTLILKLELLGPIRRGIVNMYGTAYVGDKIVSEGELTAQIHRRS